MAFLFPAEWILESFENANKVNRSEKSKHEKRTMIFNSGYFASLQSIMFYIRSKNLA